MFKAAALAAAFTVLCANASAAEISLQAAIARALESNPSLRAEATALQAVEQQARLEGLKPAPTIGAELENFGGSGAVSGVHGAELTLRLGQVIELGGKREARLLRGEAAMAVSANAVAQARLDIALEATRRYIALVSAQEELALASRQLGVAEETLSAVQRRVDRGVSPAGDAAMTEIAVAHADLAREHAEHERASARFALASLWGEPNEADIEAAGELLSLPELPDLEVLLQRLPRSIEAQQFELEASRIEADRQLARAASRPDLSFSAGVRRLEALDDQGLVFSVSLPFGTAQRSAYAVARTESELDAVSARRQAALLEAQQTLFARYQELRHAQTEFAALDQRILPAAERSLALARAGFDDARYSILQVTQAQSTLLQLQQDRLAAAARFHTLLAEIERSTAAAGDTP